MGGEGRGQERQHQLKKPGERLNLVLRIMDFSSKAMPSTRIDRLLSSQ
jgi:hypothetical protein